MRVENTLKAAKTIGLIIGKTAIRFMKIGAINTTAQNLQDVGRREMRDLNNQFERGMTENIIPKIKEIKIIKGGK